MPTLPSKASAGQQLLRAWADAFNASDLAAIVALYDDDALLWGTTATALIDSRAGIAIYFAAVFALQPPPRVELGSSVERRLRDTTLIAGTYSLELASDGLVRQQPARFSFALRFGGGRCRIASHHSSMLPGTV